MFEAKLRSLRLEQLSMGPSISKVLRASRYVDLIKQALEVLETPNEV